MDYLELNKELRPDGDFDLQIDFKTPESFRMVLMSILNNEPYNVKVTVLFAENKVIISSDNYIIDVKILRTDGWNQSEAFENIEITVPIRLFLNSTTDYYSCAVWFLPKENNLESLNFAPMPDRHSMVVGFEGGGVNIYTLQ